MRIMKLTKRERLLLSVLGGVFLICVSVGFMVLRSAGVRDMQAEIDLYERNIRSLQTLQVNEEQMQAYFESLTSGIKKEKESE